MAEDKPYITKIYENLQAAYPESFKRTPEEFAEKMKDEKYRKGIYENLQVAYPESFKRTPQEFDSLLTVTDNPSVATPEPTVPDNIDFASNKKPSATKPEPNIDFKATEVIDTPKLKVQDKQALNTVMPTMPLNVLMNRKSREVFYNTYAGKQKLNVADVREYGERVTAQRVLQLAQDALSQGDLEKAEALATSQLKTRSKDAKDIIANIAIQYDKKGDKANAERLYAPLAQVGTGSYRQPSYTPTTLGFSGKQGATTEANGEIIPDTEETQRSKYLKGIAETLEKMTPGHSQVGMIESGLGKIVKAGEQANPNQIGDTKNLSALLNLGVGLGETALGTILGATPAGAVNFQPFEVATNYLPEEVSGWLMPVSHAISKYYDGKPSEDAQNVGFVLDTALFMLLHKGYNAAKKGIELSKPLEFDEKEVATAIKASEERLKQYGGNTAEYKEAVVNDNNATIEQMKEASHVADGIDAHANTPDYEPIPHPESLLAIPEGYDVEYQGRKGTIDRGDDGTWYFNDDATGQSEQIPVKDKFNPQETLNDLGIQVLPEVSPEQTAKAMADAERTGWVEYKGKRYFVSLGNPKIEGSFDYVAEQTPDGKLVNRFDSHPDPVFAQNRKLKIANMLLEQEGLPKRESLRNAPRQSEPTKVVESAVTEPVSEAKAVQVQETPSVEAAEVVQEPAAVEAAEITPTEEGKPNVKKYYYQGIPKNTPYMQGLIDGEGNELVQGSVEDVTAYKKKNGISEDDVHYVDLDTSNPNSLINKFLKNKPEDAIQEPKATEVLSSTQEGNRSEGSERVEPSEQGGTPAAESTVEPLTPEEEAIEFTQEEIDKAMDERESELKKMNKEGRSYKEEIMHDNLGRIRKEDYDKYGDPNHYKDKNGKMLPNWKTAFSDKARPIDDLALEMSELAGVEITPQDIVDFFADKERRPTRKGRKEAIRKVKQLPEDAKNVLGIIGAEDRMPTIEEVEALRGFPLSDEQANILIDYINESNKKPDTTTNERVSEPTKTRERSPEAKAAKQELGEIKKATKELADFLRKGKINRPDSFATNTPGSIVWDGAIEVAAKTIEAGGDVVQAVADAITHLKESDWYKGLEKSRKVKAEQDLTSFIKQEPQKQFPLGIKNASSRAENAYLGIEPNTELTAEQKRDVKTVQENAKRYVEQGGDPEVLINKTISEKNQLNAEELSVILDYKIKLGNDIKSLSDKLIDAYANGDSSAPAMEEKLQDLTNRFEKANDALQISGYEQGLAFRMRQIMKDNDYSLAESERKWKVASKGKEMPIEVREKFAEIENKLNESQKRLDALERANQRLKTERAVQNIEAKVGKAGDKLRALAAKIESGRVSKLQGFRSSSGFDLAWDASLKVIAESLKGGAELADAIEKGLAYIRNTDWYKNLQDKKDFEQKYEDHLNKEYSKAEYEASHYDDKGKLRISKELIKDIVREGVENPDDLAEKVHAIIKEDLPDVSVREVKEAITEYGKTINQSKDALEAEVRRLKREGRLELGLEDAEQGKGVKRSGLLREKPTDRERELKRKINEELKKHPEDQADIERKWKSALDRIKTGLENSIRDITKRIDDIQNGVAEPKVEKKAIPLDADAEALKAQKKALQDQLAELEGEQGMSDEQRINLAMNNAKRTMEEYQRRIDEINSTGSYTEKAKRPMPESPELDALNAEKERLKQEYENALENHGIDKIRATEQALKRKQQQIDAITNKINSKDIGFLKRKLSKVDPNNPELKLANTQLEQAKATLNKMREEEGLINQRKLELYRKRIADRTTALEQEIASLKNGTWKEKVKPEELSLDRDILVERAKMDALKFDRDKLIEEERLKNRSWKEKTYEVIQDAMNVPKSVLASFDLSAPLRQGFVLSASHPKIALEASAEMIKHMMSEKVHEQWMHEFRQTPEYRVAKDAGLYLTEPNAKLSAKEENFSSNIVHKAWGLGKIVKGSERAYTAYLNKLRVDVFGDFVDAINQSDLTPAEKKENLKAYADFVNNATGRGKLGKAGESAAPLLNATFFAPRYVASRVNLLARAATGFQGLPPAARLRAIKDFGIYLGVVSTTLALAKAAGAEVETDPRSSDFGKIKVGNTRYDMLAGFQQPMVLMSRIFSNQTKNGSGEVVELGEKYNSKTRKDIAEKFIRSKMSPQAGIAYDWSKGSFFDGSKFNWQDALLNSGAPLIIQDMSKMYKTEGAKGIAKTVPSIFGIGVQQQPEIQNKVLALYPVKPNIQEKLEKIKYSPNNYSDNTLYKGTEEFKITPEQVEKIADLRAKYASEAIDKAFKGRYVLKIGKNDTETYSNLSKMDDEELKAELNSIYKLATQKAKNTVLGEDNWNEKIVED